MRRKTRGLLAALLTLAMVLGLLPGTAAEAAADDSPIGVAMISESFDNGIPSTWSVTGGSYRFQAADGYIWADPGTGNEDDSTDCCSPVMDLSNAATATLVFKYKNPTKQRGGGFVGCDDFFVYYRTGDSNLQQIYKDDDSHNGNHDDWQQNR